MIDHKTGTRAEWLAARMQLLAAEKELTRHSDAVARRRQELPWVRIDKEYLFEDERGAVSLADLFAGRSQLLVYHFMFGPEYEVGCPSCSALADGFDGSVVHLANHDVTLTAVSRAPFERLERFRRRMGWTFPWASSFGSDFNSDFSVGFTVAQQEDGGIDYNYRREAAWAVRDGEGFASRLDGTPVADSAALAGTDVATYTRERPGVSAFVRHNGAVYHTYSTFARGLDGLWVMYQWLDRAPLGRNEKGIWWRHHDDYGGSQRT
ncbi:MAG: thioredoxin family protein [Planctomycetota bacterium]